MKFDLKCACVDSMHSLAKIIYFDYYKAETSGEKDVRWRRHKRIAFLFLKIFNVDADRPSTS